MILVTYNQPAWLEEVIGGYAAQQIQQFEMVVADDGSTQDTAERISRLRVATGHSIQHVWHEDLGLSASDIPQQERDSRATGTTDRKVA